MMRSLPGLIIGALALTALDFLVSNNNAVTATTGAFGGVTTALAKWMDPTVPGIPDLRTTTQGNQASVAPGLTPDPYASQLSPTVSRFPAINQQSAPLTA